jgi:1-phosphofructokinase family hexose kinase
MFLCVSPNPAIDKRLTLPALISGEIHRARTVHAFPGGKSTHVAMVLKALGVEPYWIGLCGGSTGAQLVAGLKNLGVNAHSVATSAETRTNLEIIDDAGIVTEIREPGSPVSAAELSTFERACNERFERGKESTTVIFSGSLPVGAPNNFYAKLIVAAHAAGCRTFLDTSGEPLKLALASHPDFVKPNRDEAATALDLKITSRESTADALSQFLSHGACSAAISLGADGMVYAPGKSVPGFFAPAVPLTPKSTVGCGDAALAGFAFALSAGSSPENALRTAAACAAANCLADSPGAIDKDVMDKFQSQIRVETFILGP